MPAEPMTVLCEELVRLSLIIINPTGYGKSDQECVPVNPIYRFSGLFQVFS